MKKMFRIASILSLLVVIALCAGAGVLYFNGTLNPRTLATIQSVLTGETAGPVEVEPIVKVILPSESDITRERSLRILGLGDREAMLMTFRDMLEEQADELEKEREEFETRKTALEEKLKMERDAAAAAAVEQTRTVLAKMRPADAKTSLSALQVDQIVRIVRGMPEASIAQILQEFQKGSPEDVRKGDEIFEHLVEGTPMTDLLDTSNSAAPQGRAAAETTN